MKNVFLTFLISMSSFLFSEDTILLLIRHGQTDWNKEKRTNGQTDTSLNEIGILQAKDLSFKLQQEHPDITQIYSSDLIRAYSTAEETAKLFALAINKDARLKEMKYGEAEGQIKSEHVKEYSKQELLVLYPQRAERWDVRLYPGAETYNELLQRVKSSLIEIAKAHPGEKIAVFSHGRAIKTILADILETEKTPSINNCSVSYLKYSSENPNKPFALLGVEK